MSFHEKSAWACLVSILLVFIPYFWLVLQYPVAYVALFVLAVFVLVALLTGMHLAFALTSSRTLQSGDTPPLDERDRRIELSAAKWSGIVLGFIVMIWRFR